MKTPTIHLGGTSKGDLLEGTLAAHAALCHAIGTLKRAAPNGRDYYPQGAGAIDRALDEHALRLEKLEAVREELETIAQAISDQP